jgi:hypothetical protein
VNDPQKAAALEAEIRKTPHMADAIRVFDEKDRIIDQQRALLYHQAAEIKFLQRQLTAVAVRR